MIARTSDRRAVIVAWFAALAMAAPAAAQPLAPSSPIAFVDVTLVPMDRARVLPGQTVVVNRGRIAAVGPNGAVTVPDDAVVIDGANRYLVPGLVDAHVHLAGLPFAPTRPDFGDAPLYLAYGVTTVFNLRGTPTHLEWKRRIEAGDLIAPTIYTSGAFVNEPRVITPEQVRAEVTAHVRDGYDMVKFREVMDPTGRFQATTTGLSRDAYFTLIKAAREAGIPLVGHAPVRLGLDAMLEARQPLAHTGALSNIYFLPLQRNMVLVSITAASLVALLLLGAGWAGAALLRRWRGTTRRHPSRARRLGGLVLAGGLLAALCLGLVLPGGPLFDSLILRLLFTLVVALAAVAAVTLVIVTAWMWRDSSARTPARTEAVIASTASALLVCVLGLFWLPVLWRSSDAGIERLATRVRDAGISVQTTLINYEFLSGPERLRLIREPAMQYLDRAVRDRWRRFPPSGTPGYRYHLFMRKVTLALHRAGVPLVAGTDAMGVPLLVPGASLHRELAILIASGLTPYEAIRTATVNPAAFLGKEDEFGTIAEGRRADLLLVDRNPLQDVAALQRPAGVMVRGRWLTRDDLQRRLDRLKEDRE